MIVYWIILNFFKNFQYDFAIELKLSRMMDKILVQKETFLFLFWYNFFNVLILLQEPAMIFLIFPYFLHKKDFGQTPNFCVF